MATEPDPQGSDSDLWAARLRGFGPVGLLAILVVLAGDFLFHPLSSLLAIAWAQASRTPLAELGFRRPRSWLWSTVGGVLFGIVFKLVMKSVVMPLLGAPPINPAYHFLAGNPAALPWMLYAVIVGAGFGEEVFFRGYAFERLRRLLGRSLPALVATVAITAALFAAAHYSTQGLPGVEQAAITGLVLGAIYARTGRIWFPMVTHAAFDLTAVAIIYFGLETRVAHLFFR